MESIEIEKKIDLIDQFKDIFVKSYTGQTGAELELAANPIEFIVSKKFLDNEDLYQYKGSYRVIRDFYNLRCPICNDQSPEAKRVDDKSKEYLESEVLLVWSDQYNDFECPKCRITHKELIKDKLIVPYDYVLGVAGMGSGKTITAAQMITWQEHFLIVKGVDLRAYFGLRKIPFFEFVTVATTAGQSQLTIWSAFKMLRESSPWFKAYDESMKEFEKVGLYKIGNDKVINDVVHLHLVSLASNSASLAGRRRVGFVIDELARFDTTESKRSAVEVWRVGERSLKLTKEIAKQKDLPYWIAPMIAIGSPISKDDFLMTKYNSMDVNTYKFKQSTWEFNPVFYKKEDFEEAYNEDPVGAERDFGANPAGSEMPFIDDWATFCSQVMDRSRQEIVKFRKFIKYDNSGREFVSAEIESLVQDNFVHVIAGDAGRSSDTYALSMMHVEGDKFVLDFTLHLLPDRGLKRLVDYTAIMPIIDRLATVYKIGGISFDYWNTEELVQQLSRKYSFPVKQYAMSSVKVGDMMTFRRDAYFGKVKMPAIELGKEDGNPKLMDSLTRLYWEIKRMVRSKDLTRIDHSKTSTSDLIETVVNAHRLLTQLVTNSSSEVVSINSGNNFKMQLVRGHGLW